MKIALAQFNPVVGDLGGNVGRLALMAQQASAAGASLMLTPELALCGYPPEDLALRPDFYQLNAAALNDLAQRIPPQLTLVVGYPEAADDRRYNSAAVLRGGQIVANYHKQKLPNYGVFDEKRTFVAGSAPCVFEHEGRRVGVLVCEDAWSPAAAAQAQAAGAELLLVLNASPFHSGKQNERHPTLASRCRETGLPAIYLNMLGGQYDLVMDCASFAMDAAGNLTFQAPAFVEQLALLDWADAAPRGEIMAYPDEIPAIYQALVLGVRDYIGKNGFPSAILGLSGGIDSALALCVAVDALGADRVYAVMMPSQFSADISLEDAESLATNLGVHYRVLPIKHLNDTFLDALAEDFDDLPFDTTEENIQARIRGVLLMALSNKFGHLVLTTGNKSEMATGYATLYGDMAGGLGVLKDVSKTRVWALSRYRNTLSAVIPERIIVRPPTAELRFDQCDQDSLPPYEILDQIIAAYVEQDRAPAEIVALGIDAAMVEHTVRLIDRNEYKRRQAAPGISITPRGFGRDRRYPVTHRYKAPF